MGKPRFVRAQLHAADQGGEQRPAIHRPLLTPFVPALETNRIILAFHVNAPLVLHAPDMAWPGFVSETSLTRTEPVPVRPPRV